MRRFFFNLAGLWALLLLLSGCSGRRGTVEIRIVATSDVHGCFYATDALNGNERKGSLAKFSSFLKREREANGNLIYLDAGDVLAGSVEAYHDMTAEFYEPSLAAVIYNRLGCDAAVFGNHELAEGAEVYMRFHDACEYPVLGANLMYDDPGDFLPPYRIIERHGVRVAVIGFTTPSVSYTVPADVFGMLAVSDIVESARYWIPVIREKEKPDIMIGLLHSGYENSRAGKPGIEENAARHLAAEVPGFDVIIYGHDHIPHHGTETSSDGSSVLLLNPGANAERAAVATITLTFKGGEVTGRSVTGMLSDITGEEPDESFSREFKPRYDKMYHYADSVIGQLGSEIDFRGSLLGTTSGMNYIHYHQMRFQAAEVSLATVSVYDVSVPTGDFTIRDAFRVCPFENRMMSVLLSGAEIKDILEYSASCFYNRAGKGTGPLLKDGVRNGYYISACGIDYTIDVTREEGDRVRILSMSDGKPFDMNRNYRTTVNSFMACGAESPLFKVPGLTRDGIRRRTIVVSGADIRYYIITDFYIKGENGKSVTMPDYGNWCLIPENSVKEMASSGTVNNILR
ncbi:MAG: bifunctional metallophosphatase/5'-nucleotidase [Bacteroidaceae bacterium]|nr:bifunctional metallophosphatase/5'-nucleotidase [Bacteroidaceae bacterium]